MRLEEGVHRVGTRWEGIRQVAFHLEAFRRALVVRWAAFLQAEDAHQSPFLVALVGQEVLLGGLEEADLDA